jgi:hypothetical protein
MSVFAAALPFISTFMPDKSLFVRRPHEWTPQRNMKRDTCATTAAAALLLRYVKNVPLPRLILRCTPTLSRLETVICNYCERRAISLPVLMTPPPPPPPLLPSRDFQIFFPAKPSDVTFADEFKDDGDDAARFSSSILETIKDVLCWLKMFRVGSRTGG